MCLLNFSWDDVRGSAWQLCGVDSPSRSHITIICKSRQLHIVHKFKLRVLHKYRSFIAIIAMRIYLESKVCAHIWNSQNFSGFGNPSEIYIFIHIILFWMMYSNPQFGYVIDHSNLKCPAFGIFYLFFSEGNNAMTLVKETSTWLWAPPKFIVQRALFMISLCCHISLLLYFLWLMLSPLTFGFFGLSLPSS